MFASLDSFKPDGSLWFEVLTFGIIMVLLAILVLLILFGVRFIRQGDSCHQKNSQSSLPQTRLPNGCGGYDLNDDCTAINGSGKRSMLDWKCFKSVTSGHHNAHQLMNNSGGQNHSFSNSLLYGGSKSTGSLLYSQKCQTKQSLLLSVKVDLDSQLGPPMTNVDDDDDLASETSSQLALGAAVASNLPNIICAHTLPPEKMAVVAAAASDAADPESSRATSFGRERQNSIYLSLLPAQSSSQTAAAPIGTSSSGVQPRFDLISSANHWAHTK